MSATSAATLKHLQRRLRDSEAAAKQYWDELEVLRKKIESEKKTQESIKRQIDALKASEELVVSEHALLRYFERVLGFDLKDVARKVLPQDVEDRIKVLGDGVFPTGPGTRVKVFDGTVVTLEVTDEALVEGSRNGS